MESEFSIQIVYRKTGKIVHEWSPNLRVEVQFEDALLGRLQKKGVGILRTENHVLNSVRTALKELLYDLKSMV